MIQVAVDFCNCIYTMNILEHALRSEIDKDFKKKGEKHLSFFNQIEITKDFIENNKEKLNMLKFINYTDNAIAWLDGNNIVAIVAVNKQNNDKYRWITTIEVSPEYRGYGLGKECLSYAVRRLKGNSLIVPDSNKIALKIYRDYGFNEFKIEDCIDNIKPVYFMYLKGDE